ncbi:hypothetical protein Pan181_44580 [Aeoliella mucimassa]|uniref:Uncharacterized protein n=2 Tax=Aeoliella mucimassa TaxID=2527972 RepID=A0A518AU48_9BACT|nr:hypothetical protein Pan181_44580 [Aeoliella mucimassa]
MLYQKWHWEFLGRWIIRTACMLFLAGAGADDAAIEVVEDLGEDGKRLLKQEAIRQNCRFSVAQTMIVMLDID